MTVLPILGLTPQAISHHPFGVQDPGSCGRGSWILTKAAALRAALRNRRTEVPPTLRTLHSGLWILLAVRSVTFNPEMTLSPLSGRILRPEGGINHILKGRL